MTIPSRRLQGVAARMRSGETFLNGFCSVPAPIIAEMLGRQGFDSVTVDIQHGLMSYETALAMLPAIHAGGAMSLCRVLSNDEGMIGKVLDAGFSGVICPMVNSAAEAQKLVMAGRYPPVGRRSWGPVGAGQAYGPSYTERASDLVSLFAMIETVEAIEAIDEILAVDGLDGIYVGPSDLALSMGFAPAEPFAIPQVMAAVEGIKQSAIRAGKLTGIHCTSPEMVVDCLGKGYGLATLSTDFALLRGAVNNALSKIRARVPAPMSEAY